MPELARIQQTCFGSHSATRGPQDTERCAGRRPSGIRRAALTAALALTAAASHAAPPDAPDVEIIERTQHYLVKGATAHSLNTQVRTVGPLTSTGRRVWGLTHWEVHARYAAIPGPTGCRLERPRTQLAITTTLPKWRSTAGANRALRAQWRDLLTNLIEHELTHCAGGLLAARRAAAGLHHLGEQPDCAVLDREVRSLLRQTVGASRKLSLAYDRETQFGASEGVRLESEKALSGTFLP